jgi:hypothetical protein
MVVSTSFETEAKTEIMCRADYSLLLQCSAVNNECSGPWCVKGITDPRIIILN